MQAWERSSSVPCSADFRTGDGKLLFQYAWMMQAAQAVSLYGSFFLSVKGIFRIASVEAAQDPGPVRAEYGYVQAGNGRQFIITGYECNAHCLD